MSGSHSFSLVMLIGVAVSTVPAPVAEAGQTAGAGPAKPEVRQIGRQEGRAEEIDVELREAEGRLADAAARIAELSSRRLPVVVDIERRVTGGNRPLLGVTIGADDRHGPVEGVTIRGVTPGGAAAEAGLRSGDVITAVNDESLNADTDREANRRLLDFLSGVEEGDLLEVEYLRNGKRAAVEVRPRQMVGRMVPFAPHAAPVWRPVPAPMAPGAPANLFQFVVDGGAWSDMEMVSLTGELGRYFGTDEGLLIVRAPTDENLKLRDGDVIQRIDGREPTSVSHAMRILGSYQGGESLKLTIMRDRKRETLSIEIPDNRSSFVPRIQRMPPDIEPHPVPAVRPAGDVLR